jgi:hypothetical protein
MLTTTCPTCGRNPCPNPHFCSLCREADAERARKSKPSDVLLKEDRAAASTVEALMLGLRERGTKALEEPAAQRRIAELSDKQVIEVGDRLQNLNPEIARPWSPEEIKILLQARTK